MSLAEAGGLSQAEEEDSLRLSTCGTGTLRGGLAVLRADVLEIRS